MLSLHFVKVLLHFQVLFANLVFKKLTVLFMFFCHLTDFIHEVLVDFSQSIDCLLVVFNLIVSLLLKTSDLWQFDNQIIGQSDLSSQVSKNEKKNIKLSEVPKQD